MLIDIFGYCPKKLYYAQETLYQTPEHVGKMLISTTMQDFLINGGPIYLPIKYRNFALSPFKYS